MNADVLEEKLIDELSPSGCCQCVLIVAMIRLLTNQDGDRAQFQDQAQQGVAQIKDRWGEFERGGRRGGLELLDFGSRA